MDLKIYERTRYQNIYRHKKNKNYMVMMSKPVKTSISRIDGKKITTVEEAIKIRDNVLLKQQKAIETLHKDNFDDLWDKYMFHCKNIAKLAYNTIIRKEKSYNRYLKEKITISVSKTNKDFWAKYINDLVCSDKQKNQIIKELKSFFNWCLEEDLILTNPVARIPKYKVVKNEMKYWLPQDLEKMLETLDKDIQSSSFKIREVAYRTKVFTLIGFALGDRVGETRALAFKNIDKEKKIIRIEHSISYDTKSYTSKYDSFVSNTKTYSSQRDIDVTDKIIDIIEDYRNFLEVELEYEVNEDTLIFLNFSTGKPLSDASLRKAFYDYCEKAEIPKIRMYDLRHTYVATMMSEGLELYHISERLGHSNYNTTVNKYGHLSNELRKTVAKTTDKYF